MLGDAASAQALIACCSLCVIHVCGSCSAGSLVVLAVIASLVPVSELPQMRSVSDKFEHVVALCRC